MTSTKHRNGETQTLSAVQCPRPRHPKKAAEPTENKSILQLRWQLLYLRHESLSGSKRLWVLLFARHRVVGYDKKGMALWTFSDIAKARQKPSPPKRSLHKGAGCAGSSERRCVGGVRGWAAGLGVGHIYTALCIDKRYPCRWHEPRGMTPLCSDML